MSRDRQFSRTDLFLVRVWAEDASDGETEWRGKVQRAVNGETRYFENWPQLLDLLQAMMPTTGGEGKTQQDDFWAGPGLEG